MNQKEEHTAKQAKKHVKKNKKNLIKKFADPAVYPSMDMPTSVFMAGSPGAGKTEIVGGLIDEFETSTVHIDADQIRAEIPGYIPKKAYIMHGPASLGVEKIMDSCLKNGQSFVLDGMFANYKKACQNLDRSLSRNRKVIIIYVYQEPKIAWRFTQKRERKIGRNIPKTAFIKGFFKSKEVVQKVKREYKENVTVHVVEKNFVNKNKNNFWPDIQNIDNYIKIKYSAQELENML